MKYGYIEILGMILIFSGCQTLSKQTTTTFPKETYKDNVVDLFTTLEKIRQEERLAGLGAAVVTDSGIVAIGIAGEKRKGSKKWLTLNDLFYTGSNHKSMTGLLAGMLVDLDIISWNSTLEDIFPELLSEMNPEMKKVTLEMLLTHRSGIPRNYSIKSSNKLNGTPSERAYDLVAESSTINPEFTPGNGYLYSNTGFSIAGAMLERATGKPIEDLFQQYLLQPLGLASYRFGRKPKKNQPLGHHFLTGQTWNLPFFPAREPEEVEYLFANSAYSTIPDFSTYASFLLSVVEGNSQILSKENSNYMYQNPKFGYSFGLGRSSDGEHFQHRGAVADFWCDIHLYPKKNLALVVFTNEGNAKRVNRAFKKTEERLLSVQYLSLD